MEEEEKSVSRLVDKIKELSTFNEIAKLLNSSLNLREVLSLVMKLIASLVKAEAWSVALVDRETNELVFEATTGEKSQQIKEMRLQMGQGIAGWVARQRKPAIIQDVSSDPRFFSQADQATDFKTKSVLCVPLISKGTLVGVVEVINKLGGDPFTENDLELISSLVDHAAVAIHNTELYDRTKKKVKELSLLYEVGAAIASTLDLEEMLNKAAHLIQMSLDSCYIAIFLKEPSKDEVVLKAFSGSSEISPSRTKIRLGVDGLIGWSMVGKRSILVEDVEKQPRYLKGIENIKSELVVPLLKEGKVLGAMDMGSEILGAFTQESIQPIEQLAGQLSIAIQNITLYEKVGVLAVTDDLTKLHNSRYCQMFLQKAEALAKTSGNPLSLIFLDADYFKEINDTYGHHFGAAALIELADRIRELLREDYVASRYGGDEYIIMMPNTSLDEALEWAEKLRKLVADKPFLTDKNVSHSLTISLGVATYPGSAETAWDLLVKADKAMYHVKDTGRNGVHAAPGIDAQSES
ncbi:diguanylate cyclase [candidate division TA06 bacterium]|uniref:Diguanylate cyclase n=1 Tax=candidate division TA06 bacterium TaxID=2250710 RepID=A0A523UQC9_UNCT6|nr:MAG: diguanylate cyclase [candidate division TA06 bacterium]